MDKIFYILLSLFIFCFTHVGAQVEPLTNFLISDSLVNLGIRNKAYPGAQLLVFSKDSILLHKSYGFHTYDSITKVENTNLYDLASVTKVLAGTLAFMKLYELYEINLNDKVSDYLPALKRSNKKNTSFKEVLSHSAGWLPYIAHQNLIRKKMVFLNKEHLNQNNLKDIIHKLVIHYFFLKGILIRLCAAYVKQR